MDFTITFKLDGGAEQKAVAAVGASILEVAQQAGIALDAPCAGSGTCGKCRVRVIGGAVDAKPGDGRISEEDFACDWRLACQSRVCADATLWVPASGSVFKGGIQTADLSTPEQVARFEGEMAALFSADSGLARGCGQTGFGVAVDIGTTTVTAVLADLASGCILGRASAGNDQIRYGADVINRIIAQGRPGGIERLRNSIVNATLAPMVDAMCAQAGVAAASVVRCVIAGNTTMEHLLVGADAQSIRLEPFVPEFLELRGKTAAELGLPFAADAPVVLAPNVGSYVGGDITAGVLATRLWATDEMTLFIDLGTNGELVLGNGDFMLTCACSAGPAFEGGNITCGMRATGGAIEACEIDAETMEPRLSVIGGGKPAGLCGSGIIDTVAELFRAGIIDARGKFAREGRRVLRDEYGAGRYVLAFAGESATGHDVFINETDLDNFVRAKASIFSAFKSLTDSVGLAPTDVDRVIIAGGIGSGISIPNAIEVGMLPPMPVEKYSYAGNSSLTGAAAMLLSSDAEERVFDLARNMTYIELSTHPGYMDEFIAACFIPHTNVFRLP